MKPSNLPIVIATRGSALALAQAHLILDQCREAFPQLTFEIRILKTTGDKLQTASLANPVGSIPKGLFTKELEVALEKREADLAVHSLKDLPTELPEGLKLGAVGKRADVRDVLIYRDAAYRHAPESGATGPAAGGSCGRGLKPGSGIADLSRHATVATSSTRRKAQLLADRPDLMVVEIRGNVGTRLQKLAERPEIDAIVLAAAGLERLGIRVTVQGRLEGRAVPDGLLATILEPEVMLPCVGQGALGIEVRADDERMAAVCERLNHLETQQCVTAERAFLNAMGGGCQSPIAAYADVVGGQVRLRALSFQEASVRRGEHRGPFNDAAGLGRRLAAEIKSQ